jgi:hypothetical protein
MDLPGGRAAGLGGEPPPPLRGQEGENFTSGESLSWRATHP